MPPSGSSSSTKRWMVTVTSTGSAAASAARGASPPAIATPAIAAIAATVMRRMVLLIAVQRRRCHGAPHPGDYVEGATRVGPRGRSAHDEDRAGSQVHDAVGDAAQHDLRHMRAVAADDDQVGSELG